MERGVSVGGTVETVLRTRVAAWFASFFNWKDECFTKTMQFLCSGPVLENLEACQATVKKLADIFFIAAQFDEIKVCYAQD
jgi:hypothetical protein